MIATQNAGADTPTIESTITTVSMPFPLLTAAKIPHGIPITEDKGHACQLYGYLKAAEQRIGNNLLGEIGGTEIQMDGAFYKIQILYIVWQIQTELLTHFGDSLRICTFL